MLTSKRSVPFTKPDIGEREREAVERVLRSGWLTTGVEAAGLEDEFAAAVGAESVVAVNSATAAMHLALLAWGIGPGDEVITTPLTFVSTAHVICHVGASPVFADVDADMQLDPDAVASAIGARTRAVIAVHYAGMACDLARLRSLAERHGLFLLEDAAHAVGTAYDGKPIGQGRAVAAFSLYATKPITAGEGGLLTCGPELAPRIRSLSLHGMSRDAWKRYEVGGAWAYDVAAEGFKYNLSDLQAALARAQLARDAEMRERRRAIALRYDDAFRDLAPTLELPPRRTADDHSWHLYVIRVAGDRNGFAAALVERGVGVSVHFMPVHLFSFYRERFQTRPGQFPKAEAAGSSVVSLPIYSAMTDADVAFVIEQVRATARQRD